MDPIDEGHKAAIALNPEMFNADKHGPLIHPDIPRPDFGSQSGDLSRPPENRRQVKARAFKPNRDGFELKDMDSPLHGRRNIDSTATIGNPAADIEGRNIEYAEDLGTSFYPLLAIRTSN